MYLKIPDKKPATREEMIDYLKNHFRYHTMHCWNNSTSYANCIKIDRLNGVKVSDKFFDALNLDESYEDFNFVLHEFGVDNPEWEIGSNGRSGGYLVLYQREGDKVYPGRDTDMGERFEDWEDDRLADRVDLVWEFDRYCEAAVSAFVNFVNSHEFKYEVIQVPKRILVATPIGDEG